MKILGNDVVSQEEFDTFKNFELAAIRRSITVNTMALESLEHSLASLSERHKLLKRTLVSFAIFGVVSSATMVFLLTRAL